MAYTKPKTYTFVVLKEVLYKTEENGPNTGRVKQNFNSLSFKDYTDRTGVFGNPGAPVSYVTSKDQRGMDKPTFFTLSQAYNAFVVNDGETDIYKKKKLDFIQNSPYCEGSPNGDYVERDGQRVQVNVIYRLMNDEGDAEVALEASERRAKAVLSAHEIDDQTLAEVAALAGLGTGRPDKLMRHSVTEYANKRPKDYFEILNNGDRAVRAAIRRGLHAGILQQKGPLIYWGATLMGADENAVASKLLNEKDLYDQLKEATGLTNIAVDKKKSPKK